MISCPECGLTPWDATGCGSPHPECPLFGKDRDKTFGLANPDKFIKDLLEIPKEE